MRPMLTILLVAFKQGAAPEPDGGELLRVMRESAERYEVVVRREDGEEVTKLEEEPLLRWTNPERGTPDGAVYLWTEKGRPAAALCLYPNLGSLDHEWQSLADAPLRASYSGDADWAPPEPGLTYARVPDAPAVADSVQLRLSQMRTLARRFTVSIYKSPETQQVRLLTQPVYRYREDTPGAADGAVFAYVLGTDPEVLLLFEARRDGGALRWYYAVARMSSVYLECRDRDRVVWTAEPDWTHDPSRPYVTFLQRTPIPASAAP